MAAALDLGTLSPLWNIYLTVLAVAWGACIGSFLNVCIYRIPREESVVHPGSHCPHCGRGIAWYDNIPLVSFFVLRARCRQCGGPISARYVLVEALVALLFLLVWWKYPLTGLARPLALSAVGTIWLVPIYWLAVSGLVLGTFVDFEHMIIPDRVSLGGIVAGLLFSALVPAMQGAPTWWAGLKAAALGAAVGSGSLWAVAFIGRLIFRKDAMGMGDIKLLGAIGAFLGWPAVLFTVLVSSLFGSIVGVTLVLTRQKAMQSRIPYGPYLALAALIWIFWGPRLWHTYVAAVTLTL